MNYQYNQQPNNYGAASALRQRRKASFEGLAEKLAEFFGTNGFLAALSRYSDIISYILTGAAFFVSVILMCLGNFSVVLELTVLVFGVIAVSKKTLLPLSVALSSVTLLRFICFIAAIAGVIRNIFYYRISIGYIMASVFSVIFAIVELAVLCVLTIFAWSYFMAVLPQKVYQPQPIYNGQVSPQSYNGQGYNAPPPAQQAPPQQPVQPQQTPPPAPVPPQQVPPQPQAAAQGKACPNCGTVNTPDSIFCRGCGTKLDS